tara:strand:- start:60 stop:1160 length:1101 start_codon:yes stop_codon:yes gene_type:complete
MARKKGDPKKAPEYKDKTPGRAKDGSKCYTRVNKAGGKYTTCEGKQKSDKKLDREITKLHGRERKKITKPEFQETVSLRTAVVLEAPGVVAMTSTMTPLGQATYDAIFNSGIDVSAGISAAVEQRQREEKNWYILPITYLFAELYKKGMRDLRDTPLDGESRFGMGSTREGWSVVYKLAGNKMFNIRRVSLSSLRDQIRTDFIDPTELEDVFYEIDDIWNEPTDRVNEFLAGIGGAEPANDGSIDVSGIPHLKDFNLNTERWAAALGYTGDWSDNYEAGWKNVSWANDGEELLQSLAQKENKEYLDANEPKLREMKIKELKEQIPEWNRGGLRKKQDYIDYLLSRTPYYENENLEWQAFFTDPGRY